MKKIVVFGANGMLGSYLAKLLLGNTKYELILSSIDGENPVDISNKQALEKFIKDQQPAAVINCAAYTNVEGCEDKEGMEIAMQVNGDAPGYMASACKSINSTFIHISTDYVFGEEELAGYDEASLPSMPLNNYGKSKLSGERSVTDVMNGLSGSDFQDQDHLCYIIRTSWLFGPGATNFLAKIVKYAKEREYLEVVTDEVSSPTYVKDLSEVITWILENKPRGGIYHASGLGHCSRNEFAQAILDYAQINTPVRPTTLDKFPRKAKIAHTSYLLNTKLPAMRPWKTMVADYMIHEFMA